MSDMNVMEQQPAGGGVNAPDSGTYGEGADLDRLKSSLNVPGTEPSTPATQPTGAQPGMPSGPAPSPKPGGISPLLLAPTTEPDTPMSTPLAGGAPTAGAVNAAQQRLQVLDHLANSPSVSDETRELAQKMLADLAGRS